MKSAQLQERPRSKPKNHTAEAQAPLIALSGDRRWGRMIVGFQGTPLPLTFQCFAALVELIAARGNGGSGFVAIERMPGKEIWLPYPRRCPSHGRSLARSARRSIGAGPPVAGARSWRGASRPGSKKYPQLRQHLLSPRPRPPIGALSALISQILLPWRSPVLPGAGRLPRS